MARRDLFVGLMSGTSLDGIDAVLADFSRAPLHVLSHAHIAFDAGLRDALRALFSPGPDEIQRTGQLSNVLARRYADAVAETLARAGVDAAEVRAIGCHGQTVRHSPELGFSVQIGNAALLAELTRITVVADFRSRDIAAGGQGAPLVPAFHAEVFGAPSEARAVLNIGGIANLSLLVPNAAVLGFDTGPGNCLMDLWAARHLATAFDAYGCWAAKGKPLVPMLARMLQEPFFARRAPKSTGRELFNERWLASMLAGDEAPQAVQATLLELTAESVARAIADTPAPVTRVIVCGGGARNTALMERLSARLAPVPVQTSLEYGLDTDLVEAAAFAWLAKRALEGHAGNLPTVTGAQGPRVLGAIYPA